MKKITIFLVMVLVATNGWAWNELRNYEPVTLTGSKIPDFIGLPVNEIFYLHTIKIHQPGMKSRCKSMNTIRKEAFLLMKVI